MPLYCIYRNVSKYCDLLWTILTLLNSVMLFFRPDGNYEGPGMLVGTLISVSFLFIYFIINYTCRHIPRWKLIYRREVEFYCNTIYMHYITSWSIVCQNCRPKRSTMGPCGCTSSRSSWWSSVSHIHNPILQPAVLLANMYWRTSELLWEPQFSFIDKLLILDFVRESLS